MSVLPAPALYQQLSQLGVQFFFSIFSGLLQLIELLFNFDYLLQVSLVGFTVFPNLIGPLDGFFSPVVTAADDF
jgi:hypothetical protein